ncbi:MAG: transcriptional repressor [Proteobacteria bacterium]|nr:transcriptional repressor [Pseudomonadota bacterium]
MIKRENIDMKLTPQRLAILDCLDGNTSHPSAADVFRAIALNFPTMSIATVYNTLETLKEKGVVKELGIDSDKKRFDPNPEPHHHLICLNCKEIIDVFSYFSLDLQENEKCGYEIVGNHVDFYGICPKCKEKKKLDPNIT